MGSLNCMKASDMMSGGGLRVDKVDKKKVWNGKNFFILSSPVSEIKGDLIKTVGGKIFKIVGSKLEQIF